MASQYEQKRLERIRANQEFLQGLDVSTHKKRLRVSTAAKKPPKKRATPTRRKATTPKVPTRTSSRLKGEQAEDIEIQNESGGKVFISKTRMGGKSVNLDKLITESSKVQEQKRAEFVVQTLDNKLDVAGRLESVLKDLGEELADPPSVTKATDMNAYEKNLSQLEVAEHGVAKVTREAVYSLVLHPSTSKRLAVAGDKSGTVGIWDFSESDTNDDEEVVTSFRPHSSTINRLFIHTQNPGVVQTLSYDGTVKAIDLISQQVTPVFEQSRLGSALDDEGVWLQHGTAKTHNEFTFAFSNGMVVHWDTRAKGKIAWKASLHEKKVQTVDWSPDHKYLCTSSLDRSVKLWDARKIASAKCLNFMDDSNSVNCAYFNGSGNKIAAVTQSNRIAILFNPSQSSGKVTADYNIRHDNRTGRWLPVFHLSWDPNSDQSFIVGSMAKPRRADVYTIQGDSKKGAKVTHFALEDDYFASVHSRYAFHPTQNVVACGNSSGRVTVFER